MVMAGNEASGDHKGVGSEECRKMLIAARAQLDEKTRELASIGERAREIDAGRSESPSTHLDELSSAYEEIGDFSDAMSNLYGLKECVQSLEGEHGNEFAAHLHDAWKELAKADAVLSYHADQFAASDGCRGVPEEAASRRMKALCLIQSAQKSLEAAADQSVSLSDTVLNL